VIGERINNYEIVSVLGEGGMGSVFLAEHPFMGRKAAIKVLRGDLAHDSGMVERFMNEARAANAIRHPNIIDIIDVGRLPNGIPYLMMEFLEGESLKERIERQRPMPVGEAIEVAAQTASALAAAHEKTIVHRDLKPDNLFLIPDRAQPVGRIKVLDFGIAKLRGELSGSGARTQTGSIMGTPPYMSPEQCRGVDELDHRTDIYALGIILYEMLTGAPPFVSPGWGEVVHMHITQTPAPLRAKNPAVPPELERLVLKALAKQPGDRWSSMGEVEAALREIPGQTLAPVAKFRASSPSGARVSAPASPPTTLRSATGQLTPEPETRADSGASGRSRMRVPALLIGGIALAGIAYAVVSRRTPEPAAVVVPASTSAPAPAPAAAPAATAPTSPAPVAPTTPEPVAIPAAPAPVAPATRPVAEAVRAAPATTPAKKKAVSSKASRKAGAPETVPAAPAETSPPPAPPPAAAKKPDCNPNYYFDAQARKHFKPECF